MIATRGRTAALAVGLPILIVAIAWGGFGMAGVFAQASEHHQASYAWAGGAVSVDIGAGSVRVEAAPDARIELSYTEHFTLRKPSVSTTSSAGGLRLRAHCPLVIVYNNCAVNYVLKVPATAQLTVRTGDGSVRLGGMRGSQSIHTGGGSITLDDVGGDIAARTGDGSIRATGLQSRSVLAETGDGSIDLGWAAAPTTVTASTGDGSIHLTVPAGSGPYDVSTDTGDGSVHTTVATDPAASAAITARTGDGSITIGYPAS